MSADSLTTVFRHKTDPDKSLVINVEYNQLDPLLKTQGKGDVADESTGYSPFPGNANNIVIELNAYARTLRGEDQGVVLEFVNPKYKDDTRTEFKKPTRLECMMQDIPKLFQKEMGQEANIGFTMFERWLTFSPAKNALEAGQSSVAGGGTAPGTMSSAESDMYVQNQRKLAFVGADLPVSDSPESLTKCNGIPITDGPRIILSPSFAVCRQDVVDGVVGSVKITERSSLVLDGDIAIKGMDLDGALVIRACSGAQVVVDGLKVENKGWQVQELDSSAEYPEDVRIRGYVLDKVETREIEISTPGNYVLKADGSVVEE